MYWEAHWLDFCGSKTKTTMKHFFNVMCIYLLHVGSGNTEISTDGFFLIPMEPRWFVEGEYLEISQMCIIFPLQLQIK